MSNRARRHAGTLLIACAVVLGGLAAAAIGAQHPSARPGLPDRSFADRGQRLIDYEGGEDRAYAAATQSDGKVLLAGRAKAYRTNSNLGRMAVARLRPNGRVDRHFGRKGFAIIKSWGRDDDFGVAYALEIMANGKILAAGGAVAEPSIARFTKNGELDRSFGRRGKVQLLDNELTAAKAIEIQSNGKILLAGEGYADGHRQIMLARLDRDGRLDRSFGEGGTLVTDLGSGQSANAYDLALQNDGKIVLAGDIAENDMLLARFTSDGELDESFAGDGVANGAPALVGSATAVEVLSDGRILAGGCAYGRPVTTALALARYMPDGSFDTSFADGQGYRRYGVGDQYAGCAEGLQVTGRRIVTGAGIVRRRGGDFRFGLFGIRPDGELDRSFARGGAIITDFDRLTRDRETDYFLEAMATRGSKPITLAGWARRRGGSDFAVARYRSSRGR